MQLNEKNKIAKLLLKIRYFEESLDKFFEKGIIKGSYHRCIGQEAVAVGVCCNLRPEDIVVSNHRNHGHYLAFTNDFEGLLNELKGFESGVSGGRGGSQVIFGKNFFSNGILGSTVAIATGLSLSLKLKRENNCVVCFLGDGALCEGVVYESINMASLWSLPILFVVENNHIAQSALGKEILAGSITKRFEAFGIESRTIKSPDVFEIMNYSKSVLDKVKSETKPQAMIFEVSRLCPHSKGDDTRPKEVLSKISKNDPLILLRKHIPNYEVIAQEAKAEINDIIKGR